jgi:aarF domain-containing kinase
MIRSALRFSSRASGTALVGCLGYGCYLINTDEGAKRVFEAYKTLVPVVLHYRLAEAQNQYLRPMTEEDWQALDEMYAVSTVSKLGELQGMYCKYCQSAAGFTNTFGPSWIREFRTLESDVPPRSIEAVYKTIEEETGKPVNKTFAFFDPVPLGSASIGQVHAARLLDGREVAVKVQYPEAQALFEEDIHTIRSLTQRLAPEQIVLLEAIEQQNAAELDYRNEAKNLTDVSNNMIRHGFQPREVIVPTPLPEMTTRRMLVMNLLPGPKLIDGIRNYVSTWAKQHGTTLDDLEKEANARIEKEGIPLKYEGPSARQIGLYRKYLWIRDGLLNLATASYNGTAGWMGPTIEYQQSSLPPNVPRMIDTLMRVHGYQLLKDGVFNADPNGGNFTLLPDGRIGMIDYGATKRFSRNERLSACLIYAALARKDEQRLFDLCEVAGYRSKYSKPHVLYKLMQFGYDSWGKEVTGEQNIQQFIDDLKKEDPWEEVPDNFTMVKVSRGWIQSFIHEYFWFLTVWLIALLFVVDEYSTTRFGLGYAPSCQVFRVVWTNRRRGLGRRRLAL